MTVASFEDALRPSAVMAELARAAPELADGSLALLACRVSRIRSMEGGTWTAVYELDVRDEGRGMEQTLVARGTITTSTPRSSQRDSGRLGAEGWSLTVPALGLYLVAVTADEALPGVAVITDPERGRLLLQESLRTCGWVQPGAEIASCAPTVVAHKPGVRATVLCRLEHEGADGPAAVVVKVHHDDQGERAFAVMRALSESSAAPFARAIDYRPELRLSVQEHVDHRGSYKDLFHGAFDGTVAWDVLLDVTRATATGLAELHRSGCRSGEPVTWDEELAILRAKQDRLALAMPVLAGPTASVPDRLAHAAATIPADPLVPSHHSFRPAQVLLTDDGVVFIDLDKFCRAEPASDIALFTAKLQHMGVNKASARVSAADREIRLAEVRATFLDEYQKNASVSSDRVGLWEAMELTSLVLSAAKKVNEDWVASCRRMLENHLQARGWS